MFRPPTVSLWTSLQHIRTTLAWRHKDRQSLPRGTTSVNSWSTLQMRSSAPWKVICTTQLRLRACSAEPRRTRSRQITSVSWCHAITRSSIQRDMDRLWAQAMLSLQWSSFWWSMITSLRTRPSGQRWRLLFHPSHQIITSWCLHHPPNISPVLAKICQKRTSQEVLKLSLPLEQAKPSSSPIPTRIARSGFNGFI